MACHQHHHHPQLHHSHPHQSHSSTTCYCSFCSSSCCIQTQHPSSPSPPQHTDPLIQAIASRIIQSTPSQPYIPYSELNRQNLQSHHQFQRNHRRRQQALRQQEPPDAHYSTIDSLISRIEALESSLHHFSASPAPFYYVSHSLRNIAARTIQAHFRAFLVRRSRALRQLKDLALIKSTFISLKASACNDTHVNIDALSLKAMDLLHCLDSIQGGDPMIRDGKRSLSRDLVRFLELIDRKRDLLSRKAIKDLRIGQNVSKVRGLGTKNGSLAGDQKQMIEKLRSRVEKIGVLSRAFENDEEDVELEGFHHGSADDEEENNQIRNGVLVKRHGIQPRVKKSVSFAEKGNVYRVFRSTNKPISHGDGTSLDGSDSSEDHGKLVEKFCHEADEINQGEEEEEDEEARIEDGGSSPQSSNGERNMVKDANYEITGHFSGQNGGFVFSAPLPVTMEAKADLMKKRKGFTDFVH